MKKFFVRKIYLPLNNWLNKENYFKDLDFVLKTQWYKKEDLERLTQQRLKDMISHSYENTVYYRNLFDSLGLRPGDIQTASDLRKIPILTKSDVYHHNNELISKKYPGKLLSGTTSGSTGEALKFYFDSYALSKVDAVQSRHRLWYGVEEGDPMFIMWGRPVYPNVETWKTAVKTYLRNYMVISAFDLSEKNILQFARKISRFKPKLIYGYSSGLYEMACMLLEHSISLDIKPNIVIYTADTMYDYMKQAVKKVFNADVKSEYGSSELGCFALECEKGSLHISGENVIVQIVQDGKECEAGEEGEIIATSLIKYGFPFIRYNIGDRGLLIDEKCACGRASDLMKISGAKVVDTVITRSGKISSGQLFDYILIALMEHGYHGLKQFRVLQEDLDTFTVTFVKGEGFTDFYMEFWEKKMKDFLGQKIAVRFEFADKIEREQTGKFKFFISKVKRAEIFTL